MISPGNTVSCIHILFNLTMFNALYDLYNAKNNLYALYFIDFFNNILKFFPDYINIRMQSGDNKAYPITISIDLLDNINKITYIVAPRVLID